MKFINYLESIVGVGIFPMISLGLFFLFFTAIAIWSIRADKQYINSLKQIPFHENNN